MTARTVSRSEFLCFKQGSISLPEKQANNVNCLNAENKLFLKHWKCSTDCKRISKYLGECHYVSQLSRSELHETHSVYSFL